MLKDFKQFVLRGNLMDLAIGFTVGAAFTTVAKSLVNDVLMPLFGLMTGGADFADHFILLKAGTESAPPYATLADAQGAGAVTLNYGVFVNNIVALLLVALAMFVIIRMINRAQDNLREDEVVEGDQPPTEKKCRYCKEVVAYEATRCRYCTSELTAPPPETHA